MSILLYVAFQSLSVNVMDRGGESAAYVTNLGAWRGADVPFTVHSLGSTGLPVSGDLMGLNDTFWTNHVILTG